MRSVVRVVLGAILALVCGAVGAETISLPPPMLNSHVTVSKALQDRRSIRSFSEEPVSDRFLSGVLWAANGFNRPDKRTNATALNKQTIRIYVCMKSGAYLYDAKKNVLEKVCGEDLRVALAGHQPFAAKAPRRWRRPRRRRGMRRRSIAMLRCFGRGMALRRTWPRPSCGLARRRRAVVWTRSSAMEKCYAMVLALKRMSLSLLHGYAKRQMQGSPLDSVRWGFST